MVFILGLATALIIAFGIESGNPGRVLGNITFDAPEDIFKSTRVLSQEEFEWAKVAWQYFENNYQDNTGLVNSVDGYPSLPCGHCVVSYGLLAAEKINVITHQNSVNVLIKAFTLAKLPLVDGSYQTKLIILRL